MNRKEQLRFAKGLNQILERASKDFPLLEIDSQSGTYTKEFLQAGLPVTVVEPFGANHACHPAIKNILTKELEEVVIPFRSISAVWIAQALTVVSRKKAQRWLELAFDWLIKEGYLFFCLLEGEGSRSVTNQGAAGVDQKTEFYYRPEEIYAMLAFVGFEVLDAWREGSPERQWIHILAQKPQRL